MGAHSLQPGPAQSGGSRGINRTVGRLGKLVFPMGDMSYTTAGTVHSARMVGRPSDGLGAPVAVLLHSNEMPRLSEQGGATQGGTHWTDPDPSLWDRMEKGPEARALEAPLNRLLTSLTLGDPIIRALAPLDADWEMAVPLHLPEGAGFEDIEAGIVAEMQGQPWGRPLSDSQAKEAGALLGGASREAATGRLDAKAFIREMAGVLGVTDEREFPDVQARTIAAMQYVGALGANPPHLYWGSRALEPLLPAVTELARTA